MGIDKSFNAVLKAIHSGDYFFGRVNIQVSNDKETYIYRDVEVTVSYHIGYMQMQVTIMWEDDTDSPKYETLGLHKGYNSNFQNFKYLGDCLVWEDNGYTISIHFP